MTRPTPTNRPTVKPAAKQPAKQPAKKAAKPAPQPPTATEVAVARELVNRFETLGEKYSATVKEFVQASSDLAHVLRMKRGLLALQAASGNR